MTPISRGKHQSPLAFATRSLLVAGSLAGSGDLLALLPLHRVKVLISTNELAAFGAVAREVVDRSKVLRLIEFIKTIKQQRVLCIILLGELSVLSTKAILAIL